jgi:hypothetical protein
MRTGGRDYVIVYNNPIQAECWEAFRRNAHRIGHAMAYFIFLLVIGLILWGVYRIIRWVVRGIVRLLRKAVLARRAVRASRQTVSA